MFKNTIIYKLSELINASINFHMCQVENGNRNPKLDTIEKALDNCLKEIDDTLDNIPKDRDGKPIIEGKPLIWGNTGMEIFPFFTVAPKNEVPNTMFDFSKCFRPEENTEK